MTYKPLRERTLEMMEDALGRCLAFREVVDTIDFSVMILPTPTGPMLGAVLFVSLKGPLLGKTTGNADICADVGLLADQAYIDATVRNCLESIRVTTAQIVSQGNGNASNH